MEIEEQKVSNIPHLLPEEIKWYIVILKKQGYSNKATAKEITRIYERPMSHQSVKRIWTLYQETKDVKGRWNYEGRPKLMNQDIMEKLIDGCQLDRHKTTKERAEELGLDLGRSTINRALNMKLGAKYSRI